MSPSNDGIPPKKRAANELLPEYGAKRPTPSLTSTGAPSSNPYPSDPAALAMLQLQQAHQLALHAHQVLRQAQAKQQLAAGAKPGPREEVRVPTMTETAKVRVEPTPKAAAAASPQAAAAGAARVEPVTPPASKAPKFKDLKGVSRLPWEIFWLATLKLSTGRELDLGVFATCEEAARAHDVALLRFEPERSAELNFSGADYYGSEEDWKELRKIPEAAFLAELQGYYEQGPCDLERKHQRLRGVFHSGAGKFEARFEEIEEEIDYEVAQVGRAKAPKVKSVKRDNSSSGESGRKGKGAVAAKKGAEGKKK